MEVELPEPVELKGFFQTGDSLKAHLACSVGFLVAMETSEVIFESQSCQEKVVTIDNDGFVHVTYAWSKLNILCPHNIIYIVL